MSGSSYLLPRVFRTWGIMFTLTGIILGITRFYFGFKPGFLERKVYAVYSVFLQTKFMVVIKNQLIEEIVGLLLIIGLFMVAFAREKEESPEMNEIRLSAFFISVYLNGVFVITSILFTYGFAFIYMTILSLFMQIFCYIIAFHYLRYRAGNKNLPHPGI